MIKKLTLRQIAAGLSSRACEAIQLMFGCFRDCSQTLLLGFRHSLAGLLRSRSQ
jgi:hypothetical protein